MPDTMTKIFGLVFLIVFLLSSHCVFLPWHGACVPLREHRSPGGSFMSKIFTASLRSLRTLWSRAPRRVAYIFFLPIVFTASPLKAQILWVPDNQPTIQAAINAAAIDDVIYVRPGTYTENINFFGKSVSVISEKGSAVTIIDGGQHDSVVTYTGGERGILAGFTIRNGKSGFDTPGFGDGGGIRIVNGARPVILQNVITANRACTGVGISSRFSSADIRENLITGNIQSGCSGGVGGGGISVTGDEGQFLFTQIVENNITDNTLNSASGAGISLFAAGDVEIRGNIIASNTATGLSPCAQGGGIGIVNSSGAKIVQNIITGNSAGCGGGIYWSTPFDAPGPKLFNNTIVDNDAAIGAGIYASGDNQQVTITNNIIVESDNQTALYCTNLRASLIPLISFNNVFAPQGTPYGSQCSNQTGINGNISADPLFMSATGQDYRLQSTSPSVDSGDNGATGPFYNIDILGNPRFVDGNGDGTVVIDMGAYEFGERIPLANAGPDQTVSCDSNCRVSVTLDGRGSSDPDGGALTYSWTGPFGTATGPTPVVTLSKGQHQITLTVNDGKGGTASDTVLITAVDRTAPSIVSITASTKILSPAKHQMVPITVAVSARDNCDPSVSCRITSVTSNEPVNGLGDGDKSPDWTITGPLTVSLRAERAAKGNGRIYTINIECVDSSGNRATSYVQVSVPR
jgi:parallel beta-helix repeat protein